LSTYRELSNSMVVKLGRLLGLTLACLLKRCGRSYTTLIRYSFDRY
jgi:hypothetical protein